MAESTQFQAWRTLREGVATVFADRRWPIKVAVGGGLMLTILGVIFPQGLVIEHLENSRRGFRSPLPAWRQWGDKAVMGLLAVVFDFVYFIFPLLCTALLLFCAILPLVSGENASSGLVSVVIIAALGCMLLLSFSLSLSPLAKVNFSKDGDIESNVGFRLIRRACSPLNRDLYWRARAVTLPLYIPALISGSAFAYYVQRLNSPMWLIVLLAWLMLSTIFWAWLVVAQVYLAATDIADEREIDQRLAERRKALSNEQSP